LGLLNYENQQKHLPGSAEIVLSDPQRPVGGWSFLFKILPNMEYDTIYNWITPDEIKNTVLPPGSSETLIIPLTSMGTVTPANNGHNNIALARDTSISEFLCPSYPNPVFENPSSSPLKNAASKNCNDACVPV
jgi:hypothetical protein